MRSGGDASRSASRGSGYFPGSADHPALITEAAPSLPEQHRARVRKYLLIMGFRIPALVGAAVCYSTFGKPLLAVLVIAVSVPLPWIAVLIANDRPPRQRNEPSRWDGRRAAVSDGRRALETGQQTPPEPPGA